MHVMTGVNAFIDGLKMDSTNACVHYMCFTGIQL